MAAKDLLTLSVLVSVSTLVDSIGHRAINRIARSLGTMPGSCTPDDSPFGTIKKKTHNARLSMGLSTLALIAKNIWNCVSMVSRRKVIFFQIRGQVRHFPFLEPLSLPLLLMFLSFHGSCHRNTIEWLVRMSLGAYA